MTFNLWYGGDAGGQPLTQTAQVIRSARADIVGLQETEGRTKEGPRPDNAKKLAGLLGWNYLDQGRRIGILTRFKILEATPKKWGAKIEIGPGRHAWMFNSHLMYAPYQPYQLLSIPWHDAPFLKTEAEAIRSARETRGKEIEGILAEIQTAAKDGAPVFLTGDFNEPSHLDWTDQAAKAKLCPLKVAWPSTKAIMDAGFADAYRTVFPDEVKNPGRTWTPTTAEDDPKDRHDRIDFVFFRGAKAKEALVVGEKKERADVIVAPYPSDHRSVVAGFSVRSE